MGIGKRQLRNDFSKSGKAFPAIEGKRDLLIAETGMQQVVCYMGKWTAFRARELITLPTNESRVTPTSMWKLPRYGAHNLRVLSDGARWRFARLDSDGQLRLSTEYSRRARKLQILKFLDRILCAPILTAGYPRKIQRRFEEKGKTSLRVVRRRLSVARD